MRSVLVMAAGAFMLLSSAAHGLLGWPAMSSGLRAAGAPDDLVGALAVGWYWGSAAMVAFGLIVVLSGLKLRRRDLSGVTAIRVVSACYVVFGLLAFVTRHFNPHFLLFVVPGLVAGVPVIGRSSFSRSSSAETTS